MLNIMLFLKFILKVACLRKVETREGNESPVKSYQEREDS